MEEDIKILEELVCQKYSERLLNILSMAKEEDEIYILTINERQAIENLLSRLKTAEKEIENLLSRLKTAEKEIEKYKKIAYFLGARYWLKDCEFADKFEELEDVLEWARKKVEENV